MFAMLLISRENTAANNHIQLMIIVVCCFLNQTSPYRRLFMDPRDVLLEEQVKKVPKLGMSQQILDVMEEQRLKEIEANGITDAPQRKVMRVRDPNDPDGPPRQVVVPQSSRRSRKLFNYKLLKQLHPDPYEHYRAGRANDAAKAAAHVESLLGKFIFDAEFAIKSYPPGTSPLLFDRAWRPLVSLSTYERDYLADYGLDREAFHTACLKAVDWNLVLTRMTSGPLELHPISLAAGHRALAEVKAASLGDGLFSLADIKERLHNMRYVKEAAKESVSAPFSRFAYLAKINAIAEMIYAYQRHDIALAKLAHLLDGVKLSATAHAVTSGSNISSDAEYRLEAASRALGHWLLEGKRERDLERSAMEAEAKRIAKAEDERRA